MQKSSFYQNSLPPVMAIAHRGARAYAPENTLCAFAKAINLGADMVECDVHLSKDKVPVVMHDDTLTHCSDVAKKFPRRRSHFVSDYTLAEIKRVDVGNAYVSLLQKERSQRPFYLQAMSDEEQQQFISAEDIAHYQSGDVVPPTLAEVLEFIKEYRCYLNIELKQLPRFYGNIAKYVLQLIEQYGVESQVLISSFDHNELRKVKKKKPHLATAVLSHDNLYNPGHYCKKIVRADAYHPCCQEDMDSLGLRSLFYKRYKRLPTRVIRKIRKIGVGIHVWTTNDSKDMELLVKAGVSGIFTDYINRLVDVLLQSNSLL